MGLPINFTFSGLDDNYCYPASPHQLGVDLTQRLAGETDGDSTFFNDGDATPSPDNRIYPWTPQSFSGSNPPAFIYHYVNGAWIMPNPTPTGIVAMYMGLEADIPTLDGGEAGAITDTTGPMWEKVSAMDAKIPIGPGTLASGRVIAVNGTLGEEKVTLIEENIPLHEMSAYALDDGANLSPVGLIADDDRTSSPNAGSIDSFGGDINGATVAHENLPPVIGIWFIRRTARKFYRR